MRMNELSTATGVPVPTIKFYLRERLLPAGERTHPNQSKYSEAHVRRVRLIRALIEVGGLSLASVRGVIAVLDMPGVQLHDVLGLAQHALSPPQSATPDTDDFRAAHQQVGALLEQLGWHVSSGNPGRNGAAAVLTTLTALNQERLTSILEPYAHAAEIAARAELDAVESAGDRDTIVETAVIGMVVGEPLMLAMRSLAEEHLSAQRLSKNSGSADC